MTKRTVWAVISGDYSDYRVHALFEDKADADDAAARIGLEVEEFDLYSPGDRSLRRLPEHWAYCDVTSEGVLRERPVELPYTTIGDSPPPTNVWVRDRDVGANKEYVVGATAATEEAARKSVRERAAQVAAMVVEGLDPLAVRTERNGADQ